MRCSGARSASRRARRRNCAKWRVRKTRSGRNPSPSAIMSGHAMTKKPSGKFNNAKAQPKDGGRASDQRCYTIPDWRLEKPEFKIEQVREGDEVRYVVHGDLSGEAPPIRESKYLSR